ncbi:hypothetical protein K469DRAFT_583254, partial [Zopfia rhizophila CBS 207.26]
PSLYPLHLPLKSLHQLLIKVQAILENTCYAFGYNMMGDILQKDGWDGPECVELNIWTQLFRCNEDKFEADGMDDLGNPFPEFLESIAQIRHTIIQRVE